MDTPPVITLQQQIHDAQIIRHSMEQAMLSALQVLNNGCGCMYLRAEKATAILQPYLPLPPPPASPS